MDAIDDAIKKNYHINNCVELEKTWGDFEATASTNNVILFGAGVGADFYFYKYGGNAKLNRIVDNDKTKQGMMLKDVLWEIDPKRENVTIESVNCIEEYDPDETTILITGLKRYQSAIDEVKKIGFYKIYSLLCMEAKYRNVGHGSYLNERLFRDTVYYYNKANKEKVINNKIIIYTECPGAGHANTIVKEIISNEMDIDIVWIVDRPNVIIPDGVRKVLKTNYRAYIYELMTARIIIADTLINENFQKREDQIYVQVKHWGSITLKTFGYDYARYRNDKKRIAVCDKNRDMMDYVLVGSQFDERTCRSGLGFKGDVIYVGSPRSDILFKDISFKKRELGVPTNTKLLLYAPTFRLYAQSWEKIEVFIDLNFEGVKRALEKRFDGNWLILVRLHPVLAKVEKTLCIPSYVIDVSDYYDSEELVAISDVMVTDYSSIMFEPMYIRKPVFLLATDRDKYLEEEREFLLDYESLPFSISKSNKELENHIKNFNNEIYKKEIEAFCDKYGISEDGHASKRAARFLADLMDGKVHKGEARDRFDYAYGNDTRRFS